MTETEFTADTDYVCGWTTTSCCDTLNAAEPEVAQRCINVAAEILYGLSGRQFGLCERTIRPCRTLCCNPCDMVGPRWVPVLVGGQWTNVSCRRCGDTCSCTEVIELLLPGPVNEVTEVKIDGTALDADSYRVDNNRYLVQVSGDPWPICQDMTQPDTEDRTWSVTYTRGRELPAAGAAALSEFACEICKACLGDASCALPKRVTNITRQGVAMTLLDPLTFITEGRTGIYMVDAWLATVNPKARPRAGGIYSPDMLPPRRPS